MRALVVERQGFAMTTLSYVLISPAKNEAANIEKTLKSMVAQVIPPKEWIIVSDGSTDGTDDIVRRYTSEHPWIQLVRMPENRPRSFAAKVDCFKAGMQNLRVREYDLIGNLDADISFDPDHFQMLVSKFEQIPDLGVAGTLMKEDSYDPLRDSAFDPKDVFGACQIFRRECFEATGGYIPIKGGGVDWAAVRMARLRGWRTQTFPEKVFHHHRPMGTGDRNLLSARFHYGRRDYLFGNHPLWEVFRAGFQITRKPYLIGGLLILAGYTWAALRRLERPIPQELLRFHRKEEMDRLLGFLGMRTRSRKRRN